MFTLVGFGRACAPVRCAHPSFWAHKHAKRALRAPAHRSLAAHSKIKKIDYFQKQNASLQARTRAARGVYLSTGPLSPTPAALIAASLFILANNPAKNHSIGPSVISH
jgi:hypothetical protein